MPWTGIGASSGLQTQSDLVLVYSDLSGMTIYTSGDGNNSLAWRIVGPAALIGHQSCCIRDGGAIHVGH
jgi:hypothetical protein